MAIGTTRAMYLKISAGLLLAAGLAVPAFGQCPGRWQQVSVTGPSPRQNHAAAYDPVRGAVVLFGGYRGGVGFSGDTWEFRADTWTQVATTGPSARGNHAMAYDSARGRLVLFGGADTGGVPLGDTWEWDGTTATWTQLNPAHAPAGRYNHAMAFDSARNVVVLVGGWTGARAGDTWEWDGTDWTERTGSTPGPRSSHAMAFDSARGRMVLFGGFNGARLADTWELTASGWTQVAATGPSPRQYLGMDYDADHHLIVLFGGQSGACSTCRESDTWTYDGTSWALFSPTGTDPAPRDQHTLTYLRSEQRFVVFGGYQGNGVVLDDTWTASCACYANCDASTTAPVLNVNDFLCFQSHFAAGDAYANCDNSTATPILNVNDFLCFQSKFAAGCQ